MDTPPGRGTRRQMGARFVPAPRAPNVPVPNGFELLPLSFALALIGLAFAVYWPALRGGPLLDDDFAIFQNALVRAPDGLRRMWTGEPVDYWPLTNSAYWIEWRLWGANTLGYHVVTVALHAANGLLVWRLLRRLEIPGAFLAAMVFVVHPINVESVAWMVQLKNTLSLFFFLIAIRTFVEFDLRARRTWLAASVMAFVAAMLSKAAAAALPGVLVLVMWWRHRALDRRALVRTAPFWAVAVALVAVNLWFQHQAELGVVRDVTLVQRIIGAPAVLWFYIGKIALPLNLMFMYPQWRIAADHVVWWMPLAGAAIVTGVLIWQRGVPAVRAALALWLFLGGALLPVLGLTDVYFMKFSLVADHYAYFAVVGAAAGFAAGLVALSERLSQAGKARVTSGIAGAVVVAVLGLSTWRYSHDFQTAERLYRATLQGNPDAWWIHNNLAHILVNNGNVDGAVEHLRTSLRLNPLPMAYFNLAVALEQQGTTEEAIRCYREAIRVNSHFLPAYNNLGILLAAAGRGDEAIEVYRQASYFNPDAAGPHRNWGLVLAARGKLDDAVMHYRKALELDPDSADTYDRLGVALARLGYIQDATRAFRQALAIAPTHAGARAHLGQLLTAQRATEPPTQ